MQKFEANMIDWQTTWNAVGALSTLCLTCFTLPLIGVGVYQLIQINKSQRMDRLVRLFGELSTREVRENRSYIFQNLQFSGDITEDQLKSDDLVYVDEVLDGLDRIWIFIKENHIDKKTVYDIYGMKFLRIWEVIEKIIMFERDKRGSYYGYYAETLINDLKQYFLKNKRPLEYRVYPPDDKPNKKNMKSKTKKHESQ
jgi:hypothetical protein